MRTNMGGEINHFEIPHERMMAPGGILTENEQAGLRSELGKLMRIALIARQGAIYDDSASAQTFATGEMGNDGFFGSRRKFTF